MRWGLVASPLKKKRAVSRLLVGNCPPPPYMSSASGNQWPIKKYFLVTKDCTKSGSVKKQRSEDKWSNILKIRKWVKDSRKKTLESIQVSDYLRLSADRQATHSAHITILPVRPFSRQKRIDNGQIQVEEDLEFLDCPHWISLSLPSACHGLTEYHGLSDRDESVMQLLD
jgi:hypothetical protein